MAGTTGLEPATSDVTGRRSNQLNYVPALTKGVQTIVARPPSVCRAAPLAPDRKNRTDRLKAVCSNLPVRSAL